MLADCADCYCSIKAPGGCRAALGKEGIVWECSSMKSSVSVLSASETVLEVSALREKYVNERAELARWSCLGTSLCREIAAQLRRAVVVYCFL